MHSWTTYSFQNIIKIISDFEGIEVIKIEKFTTIWPERHTPILFISIIIYVRQIIGVSGSGRSVYAYPTV